jgi:hypothetical protein
MRNLTTQLTLPRRRPAAQRSATDLFWVRRRNVELDKSGVRLLAELKKIRREALTRANPV